VRGLLTDKVSLIKKNGERVNDIYASVQGKKIFMDDVSLKTEEGDKLTRTLPNGMEETYLILNAEYFLGVKPLEHIEIDVRKETQIDPSSHPHQEFHIHGNNSQMNINSPNANLNTINITQSNLFEKLKGVIDEQITDKNIKIELLSQVEELEKAQGEKSFSEKYNNFIASASNHATLWSALYPFIPTIMDIIHEARGQ